MSEVYIDLLTVNQPRVYQDPKESLQHEVLKAICDKLASLTKEIEVEKNYPIETVRRHDAIFIDGERGTGKTALMLNIERFYKEEDKQERPPLFFIGPIDPTLLYDNEDFLGVILGSIVDAVEKYRKDNRNREDEERIKKYYDALEKVSESLGAVMKLRNTKELSGGIDAIAANASSKALEQHAHLFFKETAYLLNAKALVLLIDDVDMAFKKGFDVLEVVRKFLASPYIIPIVSGDGRLYKQLLCNQFNRDIAYEERKSTENNPIVDDIVNQYFNKVMPNDHRHTIRPIDKVAPDIYIGNEKFVSFERLNCLADELVNYFVRRNEERLGVFPRKNVRSFVQLAAKLKPVILEMKGNEEACESFFESLLKKEGKYGIFLQGVEEFYRYSTDWRKFLLSILCKNDMEALRCVSERDRLDGYEAFKARFFQDEEYQNILSEKLFGCTDHTSLDKQNSVNNRPENNRIELYKIKKEPFVSEIYIRKPDKKNRSEIDPWKNSKVADQFIVYLLSHDDYYARTDNRRMLVFAGRLVAFLLLALSGKDEEDRFKEAKQIFFESPFNAGLEKDFIDDLFDNEDTVDPIGVQQLWEKIKSQEEKNGQKPQDGNDKLESRSDDTVIEFIRYHIPKSVNTHALHEILHKFFNNWNLLKSIYKPSWDGGRVELLAQRMVWIFLNAVAYFENRGQSSKTNIAMTESEFKKASLANSEAYRRNLRSLLEDESSLTYAFCQHPLVKYIIGECSATGGGGKFVTNFTRIGQQKTTKRSDPSGKITLYKIRNSYKMEELSELENAQKFLKNLLEYFKENVKEKNSFKAKDKEKHAIATIQKNNPELAKEFCQKLSIECDNV